MPKTKRSGEPIQGELPSTLRKSSKKAQETFAKAHDNAAQEYGEGERAYRVAYSALKRTFEKKGDHWVPKQRSGPSDPRAASPRARENKGETFGGVDYHGSTKEELLRRARDLGVRGRSTMSKKELARAIAREQS
jgi:cation transport regulator ChaB